MKSFILAGLLISLPVTCLYASDKAERTRKSSYSKYASRSLSSDERHGSSADYSTLNAATAQQKAADSQLKRLESLSNRTTGLSQKPSRPPARTFLLPNTKAAPERKSSSINFQSRPTKTKMTSNSRSNTAKVFRGKMR